MGQKGIKIEEVSKFINNLGELVHEFSDGGFVVEMNSSHRRQTGKQFCCICHVEMEQSPNYWECPVCGYTLFNEEIEETGGYPTLESSYEDDIGYFEDDED